MEVGDQGGGFELANWAMNYGRRGLLAGSWRRGQWVGDFILLSGVSVMELCQHTYTTEHDYMNSIRGDLEKSAQKPIREWEQSS